MIMSFVITANLLIVLGLFLVLPILIGVYVYRDATSRGMNAPLWTLIAILSPALIGLIIYLIVRSEERALECPSCRASVSESYAVCPSCGTQLKGRCQRCDYPLNASWDHCPQCGETVPQEAKMPLYTKRKETGLGKILIAVIIIPILMVILLFMGVMTFSASTTSVGSASGISIENYENYPEVYNWLKTSQESEDGIYVMSYKKAPSSKDGSYYNNYLILYNGATEDADLSMGSESKWFFDEFYKVEFTSNEGYSPNSYVLFHTEITTKKDLPLRVYVDGKEVDYQHVESQIPLSIDMGY